MNDISVVEFEQLIKSSSLVFVEFWSRSCFACTVAENFLLKLEQLYKEKCTFVKVNIDRAGSLVNTYSISKLPTFILFKNSVEKARIDGFKKKENDIERAIRLNF